MSVLGLRRSTTIDRIGTAFSRTVCVNARSIAVCSNGDSPRASTVSASAPIRSRLRAVTVEAHYSSDSPDGRWPSSRGFRRVLSPWPATIARPPTALATAVCSPFGSPGT